MDLPSIKLHQQRPTTGREGPNGMKIRGDKSQKNPRAQTKAVEPSQLLRDFEGAQILKAIEEPSGPFDLRELGGSSHLTSGWIVTLASK